MITSIMRIPIRAKYYEDEFLTSTERIRIIGVDGNSGVPNDTVYRNARRGADLFLHDDMYKVLTIERFSCRTEEVVIHRYGIQLGSNGVLIPIYFKVYTKDKCRVMMHLTGIRDLLGIVSHDYEDASFLPFSMVSDYPYLNRILEDCPYPNYYDSVLNNNYNRNYAGAFSSYPDNKILAKLDTDAGGVLWLSESSRIDSCDLDRVRNVYVTQLAGCDSTR